MSNNNKTIVQWATKTGLAEGAVRGLMTYLTEIGAVSSGRVVNPPGTKGKPANTYALTPENMETAVLFLSEFLPSGEVSVIADVAPVVTDATGEQTALVEVPTEQSADSTPAA